MRRTPQLQSKIDRKKRGLAVDRKTSTEPHTWYGDVGSLRTVAGEEMPAKAKYFCYRKFAQSTKKRMVDGRRPPFADPPIDEWCEVSLHSPAFKKRLVSLICRRLPVKDHIGDSFGIQLN
jgi:hypothetical protein